MIKVVFDGMCEGCQCADLSISIDHKAGCQKEWRIKCTHYEACWKMESKTRKSKRGDANV